MKSECLAEAGYNVKVYCWDRSGKRPSRETLKNVEVHNMRYFRVPVFSRVSYAVLGVLFQIHVALSVLRVFKNARPTIELNDLNSMIVGQILRWFWGDSFRIVYDSHEFTPLVYEVWYNRTIGVIAGRVEAMLGQEANEIIAPNELIAKHLSEVTGNRSTVVYNCPPLPETLPGSKEESKKIFGLSGFHVVFFPGRARVDYDLDLLLDAALSIRQRGKNDIKYLFLGPPSQSLDLEGRVRSKNLEDAFVFGGWVDGAILSAGYRGSDLVYVVTSGNHGAYLTPWKLFEAMANGVPAVVREGTLSARIVRETSCGVIIGQPLRDSLLTTLSSLGDHQLASLGNNGRAWAEKKYNWASMALKVVGVYAGLEERKA